MSDVLVASFALFRFGFRTSSYIFPSKPYIIIMPENIFPLHGAMVKLIQWASYGLREVKGCGILLGLSWPLNKVYDHNVS